MSKIAIAEQFYSIQGEGPFAGCPAVFLRLAGCNLCCGGWENADRDAEDMQPEGGAGWVCDTIDVWREAERRPEASELVEEWKARGWLDSLSRRAHLILTGGEPTLRGHQRSVIKLVAEMIRENTPPFIEVETNGTIEPMTDYDRYINHYNVSLKLENSGMERDERLDEDALDFYAGNEDAQFKFVISDEDDVEEVMWLAQTYNIQDWQISLMPAGQTQEQLRETYPIVAEQCKNSEWRFSPRLHVDAWNQATGV